LTEGGLPVADGMTAEEVAENIAFALQGKILNAPQNENADEPETETQGEIGRVVCKNLHHVYNAKSAFETYALNGVDLEIFPGDFFGIIGHTGSGKSTFVQHLNALLRLPTAEKKYKPKKVKKGQTPPLATTLRVNGYDLTDKNTDFKELRSKVGMVFQYPEYQLFAETVKEDVAFGLHNFKASLSESEIETAVREALSTVGLDYEQVKNRSPFELSGGQKRRVAIAGVIVTKPEILILDEPAAGLDPLGKEEIMELLHKIHREWCKTVVIVSHDMDEIAENCNRAAIFSEGKLVGVDKPKKLFREIEKINKVGLDVPFTTKVVCGLRNRGIEIECDFTVQDFLRKTLNLIKTTGAGMRSPTEGGRENA